MTGRRGAPPDLFDGEPLPAKGPEPSPEVSAFLGEPKTRKRGKTIADGEWSKLLARADAGLRGEAEDRTEWGARELVAAYAVLHRGVYGLDPAELGPTERLRAAALANRMLAREFGGSATEAVEFFRWAWQREKSREVWRKENGREGFRITWRIMFGGALLTDWRLNAHRTAVKR